MPAKGNDGNTSALYVWNGFSLFWGTSFHTDPHQHNTLQLVFDIEKQFRLKDAGTQWVSYRAAIISAGHMHQLDSCGSIQLFIYLDAESQYAQRLTERYLSDCSMAGLSETGIRQLSTDFFKKLLLQSDCDTLFKGCQQIFRHLLEEKERGIDSRVRTAIDFISQAQSRGFKVADVASHVCLSESRLRHLFKDQVGQPIQNFITWMKVVDSLNMVLKGKELSQSAVDSGFWDGSHMNRSYHKLLGLAPGKVKEYEKQLKIVACDRYGLHSLRTEIYEDERGRGPRKIIEI